MSTWRVKNLRTGEVRFVVTYNNVWACEMCGWKLAHCDCEVAVAN
jgi:predicted secreted protein